MFVVEAVAIAEAFIVVVVSPTLAVMAAGLGLSTAAKYLPFSLCRAFEVKCLLDRQVANFCALAAASCCIAVIWVAVILEILPWALWVSGALTLIQAVVILMSAHPACLWFDCRWFRRCLCLN